MFWLSRTIVYHIGKMKIVDYLLLLLLKIVIFVRYVHGWLWVVGGDARRPGLALSFRLPVLPTLKSLHPSPPLPLPLPPSFPLRLARHLLLLLGPLRAGLIRIMLCRWRVAKRPGLDDFLKEMAQLYEIVVFTDSLGGLADEVCELPRECVLAFLMGGERRGLFRRCVHVRSGGGRRGGKGGGCVCPGGAT